MNVEGREMEKEKVGGLGSSNSSSTIIIIIIIMDVAISLPQVPYNNDTNRKN